MSERLIFMLTVAICAAVSTCGITYYVAQYSIEEIKQDSFMMKACVDAGGDWQKSWRNNPSCIRPIK